MNNAGKFVVAVVVTLAFIVSAGLVYMFVVGSNAEDATESEDVSAQTIENTSATHPEGEVIWSAEIDDLSLESFSVNGSDDGLEVKIPESTTEDLDDMEETFEDLPIDIVEK